ncbi:MAG: TMEM175 family protein [Actinomycetota bacterium]|nr:TMEM175 family protein [Actinomycetota bacterium]
MLKQESSPTSRIETFSDGVFAIAITLLILELALPEGGGSRHELLDFLGRQWPSYLSYIAGFLTIGAIWINHHYIFGFVARVNQPFLFANVMFLMSIAFMPWVTAVLASTFRSTEQRDLSVTLYLAVLVLMGWMFNAIWVLAKRMHLLDESDPQQLRAISRSYPLGASALTLAFVVSMVSSLAALAIYAVVVAFYIVKGPEAKARRRRGHAP